MIAVRDHGDDLPAARAARLIREEARTREAVLAALHRAAAAGDVDGMLRATDEGIHDRAELEAAWGSLLVAVAPGREHGVTVSERLEAFLLRLGPAGEGLDLRTLLRRRRAGLRARREEAARA